MISNKNRIIEKLREVNTSMTTTDLAERTKIDLSNITRYLKDLEKEQLIERKTIQDGKRRIHYINLRVVNKNDQKKENIVIPGPITSEVKIKKAKAITTPKIPENLSKLTIDELRAYYIVICKRSPKHDSKQTKEVLINEIIAVLKSSI